MDLLQTGQKLSINIEKNDTIVEILGTINEIYDDRLDVELPPYFMRYIEHLDVGKALTAKVFTKFGTIDFNTVIITSPLEDIFSIELDYNAMKFTPGEELPVIDSMEQLIIQHGEEQIVTRTFKISTDYINLYSDVPLEVEANVDCRLVLPEEYGTITFKATIAKQDLIYDNEYTISVYGMNENDRQLLLYYMHMYNNYN